MNPSASSTAFSGAWRGSSKTWKITGSRRFRYQSRASRSAASSSCGIRRRVRARPDGVGPLGHAGGGAEHPAAGFFPVGGRPRGVHQRFKAGHRFRFHRGPPRSAASGQLSPTERLPGFPESLLLIDHAQATWLVALCGSAFLASGLKSTPASLRCCAVIGAGRLGQRVVAAAGLRERDDVADGLHAGQQRHHAVPAEGDAAVRRGAELEALQQEAELGLGVCLVQAHELEDPFLDVALVDTDGAAADFVAVADDVVGVGQRRLGILVEACP